MELMINSNFNELGFEESINIDGGTKFYDACMWVFETTFEASCGAIGNAIIPVVGAGIGAKVGDTLWDYWF